MLSNLASREYPYSVSMGMVIDTLPSNIEIGLEIKTKQNQTKPMQTYRMDSYLSISLENNA